MSWRNRDTHRGSKHDERGVPSENFDRGLPDVFWDAFEEAISGAWTDFDDGIDATGDKTREWLRDLKYLA
ncbi:hypothetical protein [Haloplanus rubicundus]|uniref:hypothetical protein n=1 Tax=Haloplanus rubicundus TaxID=1547898 RepID=UPI00130069FE|nr:hypothetical protein [Haloplanus rubicundus]